MISDQCSSACMLVAGFDPPENGNSVRSVMFEFPSISHPS